LRSARKLIYPHCITTQQLSLIQTPNITNHPRQEIVRVRIRRSKFFGAHHFAHTFGKPTFRKKENPAEGGMRFGQRRRDGDRFLRISPRSWPRRLTFAREV